MKKIVLMAVCLIGLTGCFGGSQGLITQHLNDSARDLEGYTDRTTQVMMDLSTAAHNGKTEKNDLDFDLAVEQIDAAQAAGETPDGLRAMERAATKTYYESNQKVVDSKRVMDGNVADFKTEGYMRAQELRDIAAFNDRVANARSATARKAAQASLNVAGTIIAKSGSADTVKPVPDTGGTGTIDAATQSKKVK